MSPVDGGAGVLQFREVEDDFIEADALNLRHRGLSGKHRVVMTESHVYLQTAPGATLLMLPYLPKVRAGPDVPPGQSHRRDSTWPDLLAGLISGEYRGIILINAYG